MEGPTILVMNHIYNRQLSYISGVMTCRSTVNGVSLGEKLSKLTVQDLEKVQENNTDNLHDNTKGLLKAISTSCKAIGHTDEAAKYAQRCCFATLDFYGLNSLFLTTTPDDECSFRVRLYAKPRDWVSALFTIYSISELFVSHKILSLHWQMLIYSPFTGMCNKIIQKLNNFPVPHRTDKSLLTWMFLLKWTISAQLTFITMLRRWLFCQFCFAKRHQTKSSRCLFSRISECHANSDGMYATMGCYKENYKGKGNTWNSCSFLCSRWGTRQENSSLPMANMGQRNKPNSMKLLVSWRHYYKGQGKKNILQTDW